MIETECMRSGSQQTALFSIQFYLYSAKTLKLSQGAFQSPGPEPPLCRES